MSRLTLLGTIHRDPKGSKRLMEALKGLKPQVITLKFSTYGLRYRLKKKKYLNNCLLRGLYEIRGIDGFNVSELKKLLRATGIGGIRALLDLLFEYKGARFYSYRRAIPLYGGCALAELRVDTYLGKIGEAIVDPFYLALSY